MFRSVVLTLFPEMFPGPLGYSLAGKALEKKIWDLKTINIRDFALDKHKTVDDTCFGGGVGMLLKAEVVHQALLKAVSSFPIENQPPIIYLTPKGEQLTQPIVKTISASSGVILLCGRYEGIDERVIDYWKDHHGLKEISIGDYILSGGETASHVLLDATIRLLPNVLKKKEASLLESFELDLLEFPQYTIPREWKGREVPPVLLSGDHEKILSWRRKEAERITKERRPDLWEKVQGDKKIKKDMS